MDAHESHGGSAGEDRPEDEEFSAFVRAHSQTFLRRAYLLTGDAHLAEDLVQSALAKTANRWRQVRENPAGYVRKVLYHESVSRWRCKRITELVTDSPPERGVDNFDDTVACRLTLQRALWRLTPKQRAVLILRFYDDMSEADTAMVLGCRIGTVKSQTAYALSRLRALAPELGDLLTTTTSSTAAEAHT